MLTLYARAAFALYGIASFFAVGSPAIKQRHFGGAGASVHAATKLASERRFADVTRRESAAETHTFKPRCYASILRDARTLRRRLRVRACIFIIALRRRWQESFAATEDYAAVLITH